MRCFMVPMLEGAPKLQSPGLEKNPSSLCCLLMWFQVARSWKLALLSQGCVPSASVASGIRLDPDCLRQDGGMFDFICSSAACCQTLPAHLDLVPDVWVPAIRWLNTPPLLPRSLPPSVLEHSGSYFMTTYLQLFCTQENQTRPEISGKSVVSCPPL